MPREWLLVVKAFMVIESQASALDPEFSMIEALQRLPSHVGIASAAGAEHDIGIDQGLAR